MPDFTLETQPLSEESKKIAADELRETPQVVAEALKELRELLAKDDSIHYDDDDESLIIFLRPCKFYAKSAYELMKRIADFKEKHKDSLEGLLPESEKDAFINYNVVNVLKNRDDKGRRVLLVNCGGSWDTKKVTADQLFRLFFIIHEAALLEPETQVKGCVVIMDFDGLGMSQVRALSPAFSMKLLGFIQDAMPLRLKEVHMVKQPFIFNMVWTIFKPFIKEKLGKRIHFHGSKMESLHKFMNPSHLPADYKGQTPKIDYTGANWYPCLDSHTDYIKKCNSWGLKKK